MTKSKRATYRAGQTLSRWLKRHKIPHAEAARTIGVSAPSFHSWIHGSKTPSFLHQIAIERWTNGAVTVPLWFTPAEWEEVTRLLTIEPFEGIE